MFRQNCIEHREHDGTRTLVYSVIPGMDKSVKHSFANGNYIDDILLVIWILNFVDTYYICRHIYIYVICLCDIFNMFNRYLKQNLISNLFVGKTERKHLV